MAKKDKKTVGQQYAEKILKLLPKEKQDELKALLTADEIVETLGSDILTQEEIAELRTAAETRNAEADAYKGRLDQWYADQQQQIAAGTTALAELEKLKKAPPTDPNAPPPAIDLKNYVTREEATRVLTEAVARTQQDALTFNVISNELSMRHLNDFKEPLDLRGLITYAQQNK